MEICVDSVISALEAERGGSFTFPCYNHDIFLLGSPSKHLILTEINLLEYVVSPRVSLIPRHSYVVDDKR